MLIVAKNRNGALDDLWFKFNGPTTEFTDFKTTSNNQAIPAGSFSDEKCAVPVFGHNEHGSPFRIVSFVIGQHPVVFRPV